MSLNHTWIHLCPINSNEKISIRCRPEMTALTILTTSHQMSDVVLM